MPPQEWWKRPEFAPFFGPVGGKNGGQYGYTGVGADGVPQPDRRVPGAGSGQYDAHEAEFIFDADATQAIGPDVLEAISMGAKSGKVDPNQLRQAVGIPAKPGMQGGGAFDLGTAYETYKDKPLSEVVGAFDLGTAYETYKDKPLSEVVGAIGPDRLSKIKTAFQDNASAVGDEGGYRKAGMGFLRDVMEGKSPYIQTAGRRALDVETGASMAAVAAQKQQAAAAGYGPEAVADIGVTAMRDLGSRRAGIIGGMAEKSQQLAIGAAEFLAGEGRMGEQFELEREKYADTEGWRAYEAAIAAGDFPTAAQAYESVTGNPISMEQMQRYQAYLNRKQEQDIEFGDIGIDQARITTDTMRTQLGEEKFNALMTRINAGDTYDMLRAEGLLPAGSLGREQYASLKKLYNITVGMATLEWQGMELEYETTLWGAKLLRETAAGQDVSGAIDQILTNSPDFFTSGTYKDQNNDDVKTTLRPALEGLWGWSGLVDRFGAYEPEWDADGNPVNEAASWTDRQTKAYSISMLDASINEQKNTDWWRGLSADEQAEYDNKIYPAMSQLALFSGLSFDMKDDGSIDIVGTGGNVIGSLGEAGTIEWNPAAATAAVDTQRIENELVAANVPGGRVATSDGELALSYSDTKSLIGNAEYTRPKDSRTASLRDNNLNKWYTDNLGKIVISRYGVPYVVLKGDVGEGGQVSGVQVYNLDDRRTEWIRTTDPRDPGAIDYVWQDRFQIGPQHDSVTLINAKKDPNYSDARGSAYDVVVS